MKEIYDAEIRPVGDVGPDGMPALRDYLAAQALIVIYPTHSDAHYQEIATLAYRLADAMLKARG